MLTHEKLKELLHYDSTTGLFTWRVPTTGRTKIGDVAGTHVNGYVRISISGILYVAHRLAWLYITGRWPADQIDHRNTIRDDNRFENLREANNIFNAQNVRKSHSNSRTGFLGVVPHGKRFEARIRVNGKKTYIGIFKTPEQANSAYIAAKRELHPGCTL